MILFKNHHVPMILEETKTETRRLWQTARVKVGKTYQAKTTLFGKPFALLEVIGLRREPLGEISKEGVLAEGYRSLKEFMDVWLEINHVWNPNRVVWVVQFRLAKNCLVGNKK